MKNNRWYDAYPDFAFQLDKCKYLTESDLEKAMESVKKFISDYDEEVFDKHVNEFPLDMEKRRWYDANPYSWLVINSIKFVDEATIKNITDYFSQNIQVNLK